MSTFSLSLPQSIHHNAKLYAQREGISVNQLAASAPTPRNLPPRWLWSLMRRRSQARS